VAECACALGQPPAAILDMTLQQIQLVLAARARAQAADARLALQVVHTAAAALMSKEGAEAYRRLSAALEG